MHIPAALAKLGDRRAVPILIKIIEEPIENEKRDSDSSDDLFSGGGTHRLVEESCLALAAFIGEIT
jgi:hypothetical protein